MSDNLNDVIAGLALIERLTALITNIGARVRDRVANNGPRITEEELDQKRDEALGALEAARAKLEDGAQPGPG